MIYDAQVLNDKSGNLAAFGSLASVPTDPVGPVGLYIDSVVKDEECYAKIKNVSGGTLKIGVRSNNSSSSSVTEPLLGDALFDGDWSDSYHIEANGWLETCSGTIEIIPGVGSSSEAVMTYTYDNPASGDNSWNVDCPNLTCVVANQDNGTKLSNDIIICPSSDSILDCAER